MRDLIWAKKSPLQLLELKRAKVLAMTYSSTLLCAVPSAMKGLTSEFEMGSGGPLLDYHQSKMFRLIINNSFLKSFEEITLCSKLQLFADLGQTQTCLA